MRSLLAVTTACALAGVGPLVQNPPPQSQQTFRTSTDVVLVDVSVRRGNRLITGLTAADFELRDNGVRQDIETVEPQAVPIDLSVLVDVSGNPDRPWVKLPLMSEVAADLDDRVRDLTRLLRPGDRVRLFALDTYLQQLWPLQAAGSPPPVERLDFDGMPSLYDALLTLVLQPVELTRRHVIVAATRGGDSLSVVPALELRQVVERSDAQLHVLMEEGKADEEITVRGFQCRYMDLCRPTYRFWVPARRRLFPAVPITKGAAPLHRLNPEGELLKTGAESTGGGVYQAEGLSEPTLLGTFKEAFENFRQSYILRYTPKGVARTGWHEIAVTVPRDKSVRIKARNGYSIDVPPAPIPAPSPLPVNTALRAVPDLTRAYGDGQFDLVSRSLRAATDPARLIAAFGLAGNPWPASPQREAAFAIEIAETGIFSPVPAAREQGAALIDRFRFLIRDPIEPDAFEREWLVTVSMMLQGVLRPGVSQPLVENAIARFPNDPRLLMARAMITEQRLATSGPVMQGGRLTRASIPPGDVAALVAQYEAAAETPAQRPEALMRLGWFLHRMGRSRDALAQFEAMGAVDPSDRFLAYLRELLVGQIYTALDRPADAAAAFRRALTIVPGAQAARVALMDALIVSGDRDGALVLATELQSKPSTGIDPWWMYWLGDYRRYPDALRKLQETVR